MKIHARRNPDLSRPDALRCCRAAAVLDDPQRSHSDVIEPNSLLQPGHCLLRPGCVRCRGDAGSQTECGDGGQGHCDDFHDTYQAMGA